MSGKLRPSHDSGLRPAADSHLPDGGHFLPGSHLDTAAASIRHFPGKDTVMTGS